jgi:prepilin-type N-terminal cleavage/methylation domain-containing protein
MPTLSVGSRINSRSGRTAGVTLVELMVVVGIIGIITALAAPSMSAGLDSVRMASATDNVASFLNSAVNRAERRQQPIQVIISVKENKLAMISNEAGFTRELKMPDGISIEGVLPVEQGAGPQDDHRLLLLPGASVPGIGVQLINQHKNRRVIRLDPMTGFPRIETPKADQ